MDSSIEITKAYSQDRRRMQLHGFEREDLGTLIRYKPKQPESGGIVCFAEIPADRADAEIAAQSQYFSDRRIDFEWKVYDFDEPKDLRERLRDYGFEEGEAESLMILDLEARGLEIGTRTGGYSIRCVESETEIQHLVEVQESVWRRNFPWLLQQLLESRPVTRFFCAYKHETPIGGGWIEFPKDSIFAELHGGSVLPPHRGRGIYSRIFDLRVKEAQARGFRYIAVDAAPMSKPILKAKGFIELCQTHPMTRKHTKAIHATPTKTPR